MAYDPGKETVLRDDLAQVLEGRTHELSDRKMFGGLCMMLNGNMLYGVHKNGLMYRVGKANAHLALALKGARPLAFTGRPMGGMIELGDGGVSYQDTRLALLGLALGFVDALPPK